MVNNSSTPNSTYIINRIFYNYIKTRLTDDFEDSRLYCSVLDPKYEETANKIYEQNKNPFSSAPIDIPVFNKALFEEKKVEDIVAPPSFENIGSVFDAPEPKTETSKNDAFGSDFSDVPF